jgi:predicted ArsR family transcriptional regulator
MEELLTLQQTARRLGVSRQTLWRMLDRLKAGGLKTVVIPSSRPSGRPMIRYRASSLDRLIVHAVEREKPLF